MAIARRQAIAMVDFHHPAITSGPTRRRYFAVRGRPHRVAVCRAKIETGVHRGPAEERIVANPEAGGEFDFADHRLEIRDQRQGSIETLDLGAGDIDPVQLALESAGGRSKFDRDVRTADL